MNSHAGCMVLTPLELLLNWLHIQARCKWNHATPRQAELFQASSRSRQSQDCCHCEPNTGHVHAVANLQSAQNVGNTEVYSGATESRAAKGHRSTKQCQTARPSEGRRPAEPLPKLVSQAFRAGPQAPAGLPQKHAKNKTGNLTMRAQPQLLRKTRLNADTRP